MSFNRTQSFAQIQLHENYLAENEMAQSLSIMPIMFM